jgi:hypothetical protein
LTGKNTVRRFRGSVIVQSWRSTVERILHALEIAGGARSLPQALQTRVSVAFVRGGWWVILLLLAWAFAGRTTKFVYVDF